MSSDTITVTIAPEPGRVRILATTPTHDVLKAVLGSASHAHPRAAATLLEGQRSSVDPRAPERLGGSGDRERHDARDVPELLRRKG